MKVTKYMSAKIIKAHPEDGIRQTYFRMRHEGIRHMPVVDDEGKLVGMISERDLRRPDWVDEAPDLAHEYKLDDHLEVQSLMSRNLVVVHAYDKIHKATRLLREHRFGALPVLDKNEHLVGILSAVDLLGALEDLLNDAYSLLDFENLDFENLDFETGFAGTHSYIYPLSAEALEPGDPPTPALNGPRSLFLTGGVVSALGKGVAAPIASATSVDQLGEILGCVEIDLSSAELNLLDAAGA